MKLLMTVAALVMLTFGFLSSPAVSREAELSISDAPRAMKEQVKDLLGKPDFFLLDVRPNEQWRATQVKLPGAVHEDPEEVKSWASGYPKDAKIVTY